ncbi:superoxide dismutase family protein [Streptomyces sp. NPDC002851]
MVTGMFAGALATAMLAGSGSPGPAESYGVRVAGEFAPPSAMVESPAKTYEMGLVPAGSKIRVMQYTDRRGTTVKLDVSGMKPGYAYGVHVHQKPCGTKPEDAGSHYQNRVDPNQPSEDPAYLNPDNEVWLDFTADGGGNGHAEAHHEWGFRAGEAASVILHREQGGAGDRLACFTVPFAPRL